MGADRRHQEADVPNFVGPGPQNPMGARALYLYEGNKDTLYRIHGTNQPEYIGEAISSGCIRMTNEDVIDLYKRVKQGTVVVVGAASGRLTEQSASGFVPLPLRVNRLSLNGAHKGAVCFLCLCSSNWQSGSPPHLQFPRLPWARVGNGRSRDRQRYLVGDLIAALGSALGAALSGDFGLGRPHLH